MKIVPVIMAGGKGERFWPKSRQNLPKQFLRLVGEQSMLQQTVRRMEKMVSLNDIHIVTAEEYAGLVTSQLPDLPEDNIILEPVGRNTAPCVGLAAALLAGRYGHEAIMLVLPSDHLILNEQEFLEVLEAAIKGASSPGSPLVTLGISPSGPETGYGYIKAGTPLNINLKYPVYQVDRFVEKPDLDTARHYISTGSYYWNSGMFIFQVSAILREMQSHLPEMLEVLQLIAGSSEFNETLRREYPKLNPISIDYGIMEKAEKALVIPGNFGWDDVGSWTSLERIASSNDNNIIRGNVTAVDCQDCIIEAGDRRLVAVLGVKDLIVVDTEDATLICPKDRAQDVRKILQQLKQKQQVHYL
ncbi:mannose-1-phosphate guanylyltransferase [Syntrophomonas palmitatica]|uniref:mannose-1-phosphate guanylyltransferase n=1 Tax=Syntrophomonas palmitatica TaxID=402877 RepID=UPI0006CF7ED9|nr:mannose-1-phosphate guanylyltransferase [Syntrophomonas palmitatica]